MVVMMKMPIMATAIIIISTPVRAQTCMCMQGSNMLYVVVSIFFYIIPNMAARC